ncbi:DUF2878 domain-containing protein [Halomonas sp. 18H]|nr:DUF2878 domain-containing protein [Halomonas sp. 18H]MCW4149809.1 DUF2878 domain-containing protein [Halomonas sp. 18H]
MKGRLIANLAGFQLGWLACVLGGSLIGLVTVAILLALHLRFMAYPGEWRWLAGFALLGLGVDGGLALAGGFQFPDDAWRLGPLPVWLWLLWPLFASTLHHGLAWLWPHPRLAMLGGALSAPMSYFGGARLAEVDLAPWLLPAEALVWLLLCLGVSRQLGHPRPPSPARPRG